MKKKELKALAERIAQLELIIKNSTDKKEVNDAKNKIVEISSNNAISLDDLFILDELVTKILSSQSEKNS